jgi:hypothetical protein
VRAKTDFPRGSVVVMLQHRNSQWAVDSRSVSNSATGGKARCGVTGRELLLEIMGPDGELIADAIYKRGFVCVPREPTEPMLNAAWADALEENSIGVWAKMIGVSEGLLTEEGIPKEEG